MALLPEHLCEENRMLPIAVAGDRVTVAMANPNDTAARDMFRMMVSKEVVPVLAFDKELLEALKREHARVQAQAPAAAAPASASARSPLTRLKERLRGAAGSMQEMATMAEKMGVIDLVSLDHRRRDQLPGDRHPPRTADLRAARALPH